MRALSALSAYLSTRHQHFKTRNALAHHQNRLLVRALRRATNQFAYYHDLTGASLADFPVLDKNQWLAHFAELNVAGLSLDEALALGRAGEASRRFDARTHGLSIGLSSGTSGRQGAFLTSPTEQARWAGVMLAKALPAGLRPGTRVGLVLRSGGALYQAVNAGPVRFRFVDLAAPVGEQLQQLADFAPTVLSAPPAALRLYAAARRAGQVQLAPQTIYSVADVLTPETRNEVEQVFDLQLGQIYQATEGFLGISCRQGTLHLNEDLLIFERELLDPNSGRFTPVVTDLVRTSQAIIRYRMADVLIPRADVCPCGSVLAAIEAVEGRADDVIELTSADGSAVPLFADFVRAAVGGAGAIDFAVVQPSPGVLRLAVAPASCWPDAAAALRQAAVRAGALIPQVSEMELPNPELTVKYARVRREY